MQEDSRYEIPNDPALRREWVRQNNLMYVGLIGIGTIMVQPFLSDMSTSINPVGKVCVISFAVSIPLLAALVMITWQEAFRGRMADSRIVSFVRAVALLGAFVGIVAGFWHVWWVAGVVVLASGITALFVHSAGYTRVEWPKPAEEE